LSEGSPWIAQEVDYGGYNFYMWTLSGGVPAKLQGITNCGSQLCINWLITSSAEDAAEGAPPAAEFTPLSSGTPEDGSDYQGPPAG
jgi:hypothetical protein